MAKKSVDPCRPVYPSPAALITCVSHAGPPNIITLGEVFNVSLRKPPITGISVRKATYSHGLISATREFVINLPNTSLLQQTDLCGTRSGRDTDKFALCGFTALPASHVKPPLIAECPVNIECRVLSIQEWGDHDLFLGEVLQVHADEDILGPDGFVAPDRLDPICFLYNFGHSGEYWSLGSRLGDLWSTRGR